MGDFAGYGHDATGIFAFCSIADCGLNERFKGIKIALVDPAKALPDEVVLGELVEC